jgi:hypothetical protein
VDQNQTNCSINHIKFMILVNSNWINFLCPPEELRLQGTWTDGQTDGRTGWFLYTPPNFVCGGHKKFIQLLLTKIMNLIWLILQFVW